VNEFQPKDVGVVFLHSAIAIYDGRREKHDPFQYEQ